MFIYIPRTTFCHEQSKLFNIVIRHLYYLVLLIFSNVWVHLYFVNPKNDSSMRDMAFCIKFKISYNRTAKNP